MFLLLGKCQERRIIRRLKMGEKYILTKCDLCNKHVGIDKKIYDRELAFQFECPYCKKLNVKQGINSDLIKVKE